MPCWSALRSAHPLDYFYPLTYARLVPLKGDARIPSPRLHALNRALRLCPGCDQAHAEVGRTLWQLGRRRQALLEWRLAIDALPALLPTAMGELFTSGASPQELVALATSDPKRMMTVVVFLTESSPSTTRSLRSRRPRRWARCPPTCSRCARSCSSRRATTRRLRRPSRRRRRRASSARDWTQWRLSCSARTLGADGAERALSILDRAATRYPTDVDVQRRRVGLVTTYNKWQAAARSVQGLQFWRFTQRTARDRGSRGERASHVRLGHVVAALGEYRIALADEPGNTALWMELSQTARSIGHDRRRARPTNKRAGSAPAAPTCCARSTTCVTVRRRPPLSPAAPADRQQARGDRCRSSGSPRCFPRSAWKGLADAICPRSPPSPSTSEDVILVAGYLRFRPPTPVRRAARYMFRGFEIVTLVAIVWTVIRRSSTLTRNHFRSL